MSSINDQILAIGKEQFDLGGSTDAKAAVSILLKRDQGLAEVFEHADNIAELENKVEKMFKESFKPVKKAKTEKVTPKPKAKKTAKKSPAKKVEVDDKVAVPDMG